MRALLLAGAVFAASAASAADIRVLSSTGLSSTLEALSATYEAKSGDHLLLTFATSGQLKKRIDDGDSFDLCILTAPQIDEVIESGKASGPRIDLARSGIGVAIKKGAKKPDISTSEAFKQTLLAAKSVAYTSSGASGTYFVSLTEKMGIADAIKAKSRTVPGGPAAELVAKGEAELAIQQISELLPVAGTELVGPFPPDLQTITLFSAGVSAKASNPTGARALAAFLTSPDAIATIRLKGMDPG
jgi:molybdate transport system substrate-binding protein